MQAKIKRLQVETSGKVSLEIEILTDGLKKPARCGALAGYCPSCLRDEFVRILSKSRPSLAANLSKCKIFILEGPKLLIEAAGEFSMKMIQREKSMAALKQVFADYFGHDVIIQILPAA